MKKNKNISKIRLSVFVATFAAIGSYLVIHSLAASSYLTLTANPTTVYYNGSSTLSWDGRWNGNAINDWLCETDFFTSSSNIRPPGSHTVSGITATKTYNIHCWNNNHQDNLYGSTTVSVYPAPTVSLKANPTSVVAGQSSTLTWSSTNATSCNASGAWSGSKTSSGSASTGLLIQTSSYGLTCSNQSGAASASVTVNVSAPPSNPPPSTPPSGGSSGGGASSGGTSSSRGGTSSSPTSPSPTASPSGSTTLTPTSPGDFITNVDVTDIKTNSAHIVWTTAAASQGKVNYGTDQNNLSGSASDEQALTDHNLTLNKLDPGKDYYFTITSSDGTKVYTYQALFTTAGASAESVPSAKKGSSKAVLGIIIIILLLGAAGFWLLVRRRKTSETEETEETTDTFWQSTAPLPIEPIPQSSYVPHSLLPNSSPQAGARGQARDGSIANDAVAEPKDMFELGRERLEHEGLSNEDQTLRK